MEKTVEQEKIGEQREKKVSQKESEAVGRRAVIVLFLTTIILSLFFWLKKEVPAFLRQITGPYEVIIEKGGEK